MPTGFEIAGLAIATTSMGGTVISEAVDRGGKGGAQKTYDSAYTQYTQLKDLRGDILINQYLSDKDKERLDNSILRISFDLMELQSMLSELKGIAYYQLATYTVRWWQFNGQVNLILKLIVDVKLDVEQRSTQGRNKAMSQGEMPRPTFEPSDHGKPVMMNTGIISGDSLGQQLTNEIASSTAKALRSALEDNIDSSSTINKNRSTVTPGRHGAPKLTDTGLKPGLKWEISPKSAPLPASLIQVNDLELNNMRSSKDTGID